MTDSQYRGHCSRCGELSPLKAVQMRADGKATVYRPELTYLCSPCRYDSRGKYRLVHDAFDDRPEKPR